MGLVEQKFARSGELSPTDRLIGAIRIIREDDIDWMADLAVRRYPQRFDINAGEMWIRNIVLKQSWMFFPTRSANAFCITLIATIPWMPGEMEANVIMVCAEVGKGWEAMRQLRLSLEWAKRRKCSQWRFRTETDYDIGPMGRRLGAVELPPCYVVRLS